MKVWFLLVQFLRIRPPTPNIFICGIILHDGCFYDNRLVVNEPTNLLKFKSLIENYHYINQTNRWTLNNNALDFFNFIQIFTPSWSNLPNQFWKQFFLLSPPSPLLKSVQKRIIIQIKSMLFSYFTIPHNHMYLYFLSSKTCRSC